MALSTFTIAALLDPPVTLGDVDPTREYDFQDLQGNILLREEQIQVFREPGVDDYGLRSFGVQGPEFTLVSSEYVATRAAAETQLGLYEALKTGATLGVKITQLSTDYWPADVIGVRRAAPVQRIANAAGSLVASPNFELQVAWRLALREQPSV